MVENEQILLFDEKYTLYKALLFRIAFPYLKNNQDCEDVLQEVFIKLLYHSPRFANSEQEKRWLIRITINACKNQLKLHWNRKKISLDELDDFGMEENEKQVIFEVMRLPDKYKTVIYLHYYEGYKCIEISNILKISESAVKMRLKRAKNLLRLEMEDSI